MNMATNVFVNKTKKKMTKELKFSNWIWHLKKTQQSEERAYHNYFHVSDETTDINDLGIFGLCNLISY